MNYYDSIAESYDELHGEEQRRKLRVIADKLALEGENILDVGCGNLISGKFFDNIVGLDSSEKLLEKAEGRVVLGSAEELPFEDGEFDVVICVSALHNFDDPVKAVSEMKRVGKDKFAITVFRRGDESRVDELKKLVHDSFDVEEMVEDQHDFIYFCK